MTAVAERVTPMVELRDQLEARSTEFANALPSHIKPEHFQRVTLTAIAQNPKMLTVDRRSLFNALMRCAADGLLPDGRQAVLVIYNSKTGPVAQYQQMVAGVRILVQRSGQIGRFEQTIVYENDDFEYRLGDHPEIKHRPTMADRGKPILAYSIAQYKDGTLSREVMDTNEIEKVRRVSRAADGEGWTNWWSEMARKTVAKRHAKVLPLSPEDAAALAREDDEHFKPLAMPPRSIESRPRLAERLENLGPAQQAGETTPPRRRGRPRKQDAETEGSSADNYAEDFGPLPGVTERRIAADQPDETVTPERTADFLAGVHDAEAGRVGCLNRDIKDEPRRLADWQRGFNSVKPTPAM